MRDRDAQREWDADGGALDLGIPDMPGYGPLFYQLTAAYPNFEKALWHPEQVGLARDRFPLTAAELSDLLGRISPDLACPAEVIAQWTMAGERFNPVPNDPVGRVYFGRDLVAIAHRLSYIATVRRTSPNALKTASEQRTPADQAT